MAKGAGWGGYGGVGSGWGRANTSGVPFGGYGSAGIPSGAAGFHAIDAAIAAQVAPTGWGGAYTSSDLARSGAISPMGAGWNIAQGLIPTLKPDKQGNIRTLQGEIPYADIVSYIQSPEGMSWLGVLSDREIATMFKGMPYRRGEGVKAESFTMYPNFPYWGQFEKGYELPTMERPYGTPPGWLPAETAGPEKKKTRYPFLATQTKKPEPRTVVGRRPYPTTSRYAPPTRWLVY